LILVNFKTAKRKARSITSRYFTATTFSKLTVAIKPGSSPEPEGLWIGNIITGSSVEKLGWSFSKWSAVIDEFSFECTGWEEFSLYSAVLGTAYFTLVNPYVGLADAST
jgi:hypothetical protein